MNEEYKKIPFDETLLGEDNIVLCAKDGSGRIYTFVDKREDENGRYLVCLWLEGVGYCSHYIEGVIKNFTMKARVDLVPFTIPEFMTGAYNVVTRGGEHIPRSHVHVSDFHLKHNKTFCVFVALNGSIEEYTTRGRYDAWQRHHKDLFLTRSET